MFSARSFPVRYLICVTVLSVVALSPLIHVSAAERTTLTYLLWCSDPAEQDSEQQRALLFEAENPGVRVDVLFSVDTAEQRQKILTMHAAGIAPDLFVVSRQDQYELWSNGIIQPLTRFINDPQLRFQDLIHTEQLRMGGETIGIPHHGGGVPLAFNADLLANAGVERADSLYRSGRWDITAFLEATRKVTRDIDGDGIPEFYGSASLTGAHAFLSFLRVFGTTLLDSDTGEPRINNPQGINAIRFIGELANVYSVVGGNSEKGTQAFWSKAPRGVFGEWGRPEIHPHEWNVVPYPKGDFGHRNVGGYNFFAISSLSRQAELAFAFIKYQLRPEVIRGQLAAGAILTPVRASTFRDPLLRTRFPGLNLDIFLLTASEYLVPETVKVPGLNEARKIATREAGDVSKGLQSAEQAVARIHDEIARAVIPRYLKN